MYCTTAVSAPGIITGADLEFALPYALNLAEAGASLADRRIGTWHQCFDLPEVTC
jgi:hypothetical protein